MEVDIVALMAIAVRLVAVPAYYSLIHERKSPTCGFGLLHLQLDHVILIALAIKWPVPRLLAHNEFLFGNFVAPKLLAKVPCCHFCTGVY